MAKIYCPECGQPTEYLAKKPNFCTSCGHPFNAEAAQKKAATKLVVVTDEDEEVVTEVPKLDALQVEISAGRRKGDRLGDIAFTGSDGFKRDAGKKLSKKQAIEEFKREAGNSGKSIEIA